MVSQGGGGGGRREPPVVLLLRGPEGPCFVGQPVAVRIEIRNDGAEDLWMVGVVDGSEEGVRYPHYRPAVTRDGDVVGKPPPPEDPLVGPLRTTDFRCLGPGEAFDPTRPEAGAAYMPLSTFATFRPAEPGIYRYTLVLSTESSQPEEWLGRFGQEAERSAVLELVARVPRLTVTSNALEVEVYR
jgi:hypothetical protein